MTEVLQAHQLHTEGICYDHINIYFFVCSMLPKNINKLWTYWTWRKQPVRNYWTGMQRKIMVQEKPWRNGKCLQPQWVVSGYELNCKILTRFKYGCVVIPALLVETCLRVNCYFYFLSLAVWARLLWTRTHENTSVGACSEILLVFECHNWLNGFDTLWPFFSDQ